MMANNRPKHVVEIQIIYNIPTSCVVAEYVRDLNQSRYNHNGIITPAFI
jgi:hypothetical protein